MPKNLSKKAESISRTRGQNTRFDEILHLLGKRNRQAIATEKSISEGVVAMITENTPTV